MSRNWEETFRSWSKPGSDTEQDRCENAERMIKEAIQQSRALSGRTIEVFAQGSYRNGTNVRLDSDVDICVRCMEPFFTDFSMADGFTKEDVGLTGSSYTYQQFKDHVEQALVTKFGPSVITRGNKAFDVHANTYRVDADVVACFEHRRYTKRLANGSFYYLSGTEFRPDRGGGVINWPHQHYENGVAKNKATGNRFKFITRVLKRLRNEIADQGVTAAVPIPSYLVECLVWNVPNEGFQSEEYAQNVRYVLAHTFNGTLSDDKCREWGEVNELKYLFRSGQPWTREQAHAFLEAAWDWIGFNLNPA